MLAQSVSKTPDGPGRAGDPSVHAMNDRSLPNGDAVPPCVTPFERGARLLFRVKQLRLQLLVMTLMIGLLVPATAFAHVLSLCNMKGRAGKVCCCHRSSDDEKRVDAPAIDRAPCCTQVVSQVQKAPATQSGPVSDVPPAALLERVPAVDFVSLALAEEERLAPRSRGPPSHGPPIFLRDCAFLS